MRVFIKGTLVCLPLLALLALGVFLAVTSTSLAGDLGGLSETTAYLGVLNATALPLALMLAGRVDLPKGAFVFLALLVVAANVALIAVVPLVANQTILGGAAISLVLMGLLLVVAGGTSERVSKRCTADLP